MKASITYDRLYPPVMVSLVCPVLSSMDSALRARVEFAAAPRSWTHRRRGTLSYRWLLRCCRGACAWSVLKVRRELLHVESLVGPGHLSSLESCCGCGSRVRHEVDDPVNRGVPSVVDMEVQWYAPALLFLGLLWKRIAAMW